jgi:Zn-dependent protease
MNSGDAYVPPAPPAMPGTPPDPGLGRAHDAFPGAAREDPFAQPGAVRVRTRNLRQRIGGVLAALAALVAKFFAAIKGFLLLLPKLKLISTAGTAVVSIAAYSLFFGWTFAIGVVALLFVHEMGHVIQLRREGIKATAPMFVPFVGAFIQQKSMPKNAVAEARVGLAGPVVGSLGAAVCFVIAEAAGSDFFRALAYIGFFINLFNLLPVLPLDGGRAMAAMAPWMWFVGFGVLVALLLVVPNFILLIIVFLGGYELYHRWRARKTRSLEQAAYYRVPPRSRLLVGAVYVGLIVLLALAMSQTHILASGAHSFRHL